jgi:hypothetical protein
MGHWALGMDNREEVLSTEAISSFDSVFFSV